MTDLPSENPDKLAETPFGQVPVEITICVGKARPLVKELLSVGEDAVFSLDRSIDDPVELYIGDKLIARGELEEIGEEGSGKLGVRLTEITNSNGST